MRSRGLSSRRRAYRRGQSAVLFALAVLVIVAAVTGPMYERAVEQSTVKASLGSADPIGRGLHVDGSTGMLASEVAPTGAGARLFSAPIAGTDVPAEFRSRHYVSTLSTTITSRDGLCEHLRLAAGRCPSSAGEVVASTSLAHAVALTVGARLRLNVPGGSGSANRPITVLVVGLYRPVDPRQDYWAELHYSSRSGITRSSDAVLADAFFGAGHFVTSVAADLDQRPSDVTARTFVTMALRPSAAGVADLAALRATVAQVRGRASLLDRASLTTALPDLISQIDHGRSQARTVVIGIALQLVLLAVIAFGVVATAAADQRRPELALVRLRGIAPARASAVFVRELGALVLLGVVPALGLAWAVTLAACRVWLVAGVRPEIRASAVGAGLAAVGLTLLIVAAVGLRTTRQPVTDLLRQVPARGSSARIGAVEVAVAVAAVAGLVASLGSSGGGPLTVVTPTFLAVVVGMVIGRLTVLVAARVGRFALWRGAVAPGLAALALARRPGSRFAVAVLCVATALVVFAGQQWATAAKNRTVRADTETGAAVVLDVSTPSSVALVNAVRAADPTHRYATPVVTSRAAGIGAVPVVAVDPLSFGPVAAWGRPALTPSPSTLRLLTPPAGSPPLHFAGRRLTMTYSDLLITQVEGRQPGTPRPSFRLRFGLRHDDGRMDSAGFGPFTRDQAARRRVSIAVPCTAGCRITGVSIDREALDSTGVEAILTVDSLHADGAIRLGSPRDWGSVTDPRSGGERPAAMSMRAPFPSRPGLTFDAVDYGGDAAAQYLDVPVGLPALLAGPRPDSIDALGYVTVPAPDGSLQRIVVRGTVPFVPQAGGSAVLASLPLQAAAAQSPALASTTLAGVWLRTEDRRREATLVSVLRRHGITVSARHTASELAASLRDSAPGWSGLLALLVAGLSFVVGVVLLVLIVMTSRRTRQQDLAALRLEGLSRRRLRSATVIELLVVVGLAVAGGVVAGLVGAHLALPDIPVFTAPPLLPVPVTFPVDVAWLVGGLLLVLVTLVAVALLMGSWLVAGARPTARAPEVG